MKFKIILMWIGALLFITTSYGQVIKFKILKSGNWNEKTKTFDLEPDLSYFNSTFTFNNDSTISVLLTNPTNNHEKRDIYKWYKKKSKNVKGYLWDEYLLIVKKEGEFKVISPTYNDKHEIIGMNLFNDNYMLLFFEKQKN